MIFVCLAILCGGGYVFCMKLTEVQNGNRYAATFFNYVSGALISTALMKKKIFFYNTDDGRFAFYFAIFSAIFMVAGMIYSRRCIQANGAPLQTTFYKLGILIPMFMSFLLFSEIPSVLQVVGIVIVVIGVVYMYVGKGESNITSIPLLITVFVVGGTVEFTFKLYGIYGSLEIKECFLFWTFALSALISLVLLLKKERKFTKKDIFVGFLTGVPNYFVSFFSILALAKLPTYVVYPTVCVGTVLLVNVINFTIFKEKLTSRELKATAIILVALVFLNI